jgi:hypothetical protein
LFNYWETGTPTSPVAVSQIADELAASSLSTEQERFCANLLEDCRAFCRLAVDPSTVRRGITSFHQQLEKVAASSYANNLNVERLAAHAMDVDPERISRPVKAAQCDPLKVLKGDKLDTFKNLVSIIVPADPPIEVMKACHKVSRRNEKM